MQVKPTSKLEAAYRVFEERILAGTWGMGERIPTELELAAELGCSRMTIGKAVARLVHEGLVERRTRDGTRVVRNSIHRNKAPVELDAFAFIYPSEKHEGIWRTVSGFQDAARQKGRRIVMLTSGTDFRKEVEFVSRLSEFDVKGAVVYPLLLSPEEQVRFSQVLLEIKFPVVLAEVNLLGLDRPSVILDGYHAGHTMTRHLVDRGCRRISFFANYSRVPSVRDRYLGYRAALEEAGLPLEENLVFLDPVMRPDFGDPLVESRLLAEEFLNRKSQADGVVCVNDFLATGLVQAATARGIGVPDRMKVTGMEDFALAQACAVPLTTYRVPFESMGGRLFELLERTCAAPLARPSEIQIRGELISRASS